MSCRATVLSIAIVALPVTAAAQDRTADCRIAIDGDVPRPITVGPAELSRLPRYTVTARDHGGPATEYQGVRLGDVVALAGAPLGAALRGPAMTQSVIVSAADGYRVLFALPELDTAFTDRPILLVDRERGQPLEENEGPCRVVVPWEKRGARWIRQVTAIELRPAP